MADIDACEQEEPDPQRVQNARDRVSAAKVALTDPTKQQRLRDQRLACPRPITRVLKCPVDIAALRRYAATPEAQQLAIGSDGTSYGATYAELARRFLAAVQPGSTPGEGVVTLTYAHSAKGAQLVAAGIVAESREYCVRGADPFALPRRLRALALS